MATAAQTLANRANAQLSRGPITPAGKTASSQNATRHGLSSPQFAILPNENPAEFTELLESLTAEFEPQTDHELFLVHLMAKSRWKMLRVDRLESEAFDDVMTAPESPSGSPDSRILAAMNSNGNILDRLQRYSAAAERSYFRALRELHAGRTQKTRVQNEANQFLLDSLLGTPPAKAPVQNEPNPAARPQRLTMERTVQPARTAPLVRGMGS
jgi:hypothetical protein